MIEAKALICDEQQNFSLQDVLIPEPNDDQILVETDFSGVSVGTEFALIRNKISWGPYPLCTGYMGTGTVTQVGTNIDNFQVGDKVYYRGNSAMTLADGTSVSCVSGTHCSHVVMEPNTTHGAAKVPEGAPLDAAAMFVLPAVGLYGVDMSSPKMGETVAVNGVGLIGLGVVAACSHRGCKVIAIDVDEKQLALAKEFGADYALNPKECDLETEINKIIPGGADAVYESTGIPACIDLAVKLCKTHGSFIWQGNYGDAPLNFSFMPAHMRRLRMFFPCDDGWQDCRTAVIKNMAMGVLPWSKVISHLISKEEAPTMFKQINEGTVDFTGVVIRWK